MFHITLCKIIALILLCFIFGIRSLLHFLISLSKVIFLSTFAITIVALRVDNKNISLLFAIAFKGEKERHNSYKSDNFMGRNPDNKLLKKAKRLKATIFFYRKVEI